MTEVPLYYFHDPMCSWCWAYRPTWQRLVYKLPETIALKLVLGGLAADTTEPMPLAMQQSLQNTWRNIERQLGTEFNHGFWQQCQPRRSSYMACRAVLAAMGQGAGNEMLLHIQQAYYLRAMNPSDLSVLIALAAELALDVGLFQQAIESPLIEQQLQQQIAMARSWPVAGFPSWVLLKEGEKIPLKLDYQDENVTLAHLYSVCS